MALLEAFERLAGLALGLLQGRDRLAHLTRHCQDARQRQLHIFDGTSQIAGLPAYLAGEHVQVRSRRRCPVLFGSTDDELLDLRLELAHPCSRTRFPVQLRSVAGNSTTTDQN